MAVNEQNIGMNKVRNGRFPCVTSRPKSVNTPHIVNANDINPTNADPVIALIAISSNCDFVNATKKKIHLNFKSL